jgi:hypothetical protein
VWALLAHAYDTFGVFPTLIERDQNIPELPVLLEELEMVAHLQEKHGVSRTPEDAAHVG